MQACAKPTDVRMLRGSADVKALNIQRHWDVKVHVALNIPRHWDVKLNELPKEILMPLPLLLLLLLLLYVLNHVLIYGGAKRPPYNYVVSTYSRSSSRSSRGSSIKICFANSFSLTSLCLGMLRALTSTEHP